MNVAKSLTSPSINFTQLGTNLKKLREASQKLGGDIFQEDDKFPVEKMVTKTDSQAGLMDLKNFMNAGQEFIQSLGNLPTIIKTVQENIDSLCKATWDKIAGSSINGAAKSTVKVLNAQYPDLKIKVSDLYQKNGDGTGYFYISQDKLPSELVQKLTNLKTGVPFNQVELNNEIGQINLVYSKGNDSFCEDGEISLLGSLSRESLLNSLPF